MQMQRARVRSFLHHIRTEHLAFPWDHHVIWTFPLFPPDVPFSTTSLNYSKEPIQTWSGPLVDSASVGNPRRRKHAAGDSRDPSKPRSGTVKEKSLDLLINKHIFVLPAVLMRLISLVGNFHKAL
ncbi:hypothetical protein Pint_20613 [Pistacia integerrima]|uniref:Uncharacterized protein n=1 Tax=Pistacia integerrima TaxID=434235 RepID=A0ACC0XDH9_9ROSI|nr:hypothetical protein Pint_20613 [Pistacia integerrima]